MSGQRSDLTASLREDPPTIQDLGDLEAAARYCLGRAAYVYGTDWYEDGRVVAYLGVTRPEDTQAHAQGDPELTFVTIAPVGAITAIPDGDEYVLDMPDRDALADAARTRREREADHRLKLLPAVKNMLEDRKDLHYEEAGEYGFHAIDSLDDLDLDGHEWFALGQQVGMQKMASLAHRVLMERLRAAYSGRRRWDSPEYELIRSRRTSDPTDQAVQDSERA